MELDYERDLYIDESALDVEWLGQASLMFRYSKELAKAEREIARLKEKQAVVKAELDRDIRLVPEDFDIKVKVTEAVVSNTILFQEEYKTITNELIEAQYEVSMIKGAVNAIHQRKDALQDLVRLHGQRYFAGPSVPRDLSHEVRQQHEKAVSNKAVKIRRNKRV